MALPSLSPGRRSAALTGARGAAIPRCATSMWEEKQGEERKTEEQVAVGHGEVAPTAAPATSSGKAAARAAARTAVAW